MDDQDPFATRKDLQVLEANLRREIGGVRSEIVALDSKVERYFGGLSARIDKQGSDLSARITALDTKVEMMGARLQASLSRQMAAWSFGLLLAILGVIAALMFTMRGPDVAPTSATSAPNAMVTQTEVSVVW